MTVVDAHIYWDDTEAVVVANTDGMDRATWLGERRRGIGGSDAAAVVGLSKWTSPYELWMSKTGRDTGDDESGEAALWGTLLEPVVRDEVARRLGVDIVTVPHILAHEHRPWQIVNLDGDIPALDAIYEGKTANQWLADDWADDQVPEAYLLQVQHALAVTGRARAVCAVLIGGQRLEIRTVERDQALIDQLISLEAEFWALVESDTPPQIDGSKASTSLLTRLHPTADGTVRTLDGQDLAEVELLIEQRAAISADIKALEAEKTRTENVLKELCGDHEQLAGADGRPVFKWRNQSRSSLDEAAVARALGVPVAELPRKTSTFRVVQIPKRKA